MTTFEEKFEEWLKFSNSARREHYLQIADEMISQHAGDTTPACCERVKCSVGVTLDQCGEDLETAREYVAFSYARTDDFLAILSLEYPDHFPEAELRSDGWLS